MEPSGAAGFAQALTRALLANRPQLKKALTQARDAWGRLSDRLRAQATVDLGDGVRIAFEPGWSIRDDPDVALAEALELPQRLAERDGRPVVVFLDELQELAAPAAPFGDPARLQARMRAIFQRANQVGLLFAGSREHAMKQVFRPDAPLGGYGGSYSLSFRSRRPSSGKRESAERFERASVDGPGGRRTDRRTGRRSCHARRCCSCGRGIRRGSRGRGRRPRRKHRHPRRGIALGLDDVERCRFDGRTHAPQLLRLAKGERTSCSARPGLWPRGSRPTRRVRTPSR